MTTAVSEGSRVQLLHPRCSLPQHSHMKHHQKNAFFICQIPTWLLSLWPMQYRRDTSMHSGSPAKVDILLTYLLTSPLWLLKIISSDELSAALFCLPRRVPTGARILCTFLQHWVAMTTSLTEGQTWRAMPTRAEVLSKKHLKTKATKSESLPVSEKRDLSLVCGLCIVF